MVFFEYDKTYNPCYVDDMPAVGCVYLEEGLGFVTPAGNKVKVWNGLSGEVEKIFTELTKGEISGFCVDQQKRRMVVGDTLGNVGMYNITNGARMRNMGRHLSEVTHIVSGRVNNKADLFITVGLDN